MSRIGKRILSIPAGVTVTVDKNMVIVKGPKGELTSNFDPRVVVSTENDTIATKIATETQEMVSLHGTTNALIKNMLVGVSEGYTKGLEAVGVGYKFQLQGNKIVIAAGYSHPVNVEIPKGIKVENPSNTELVLSGIDKQQVAEFAANIRKVREPEPYKGKGIRYKDEHIRRKEGKKAA